MHLSVSAFLAFCCFPCCQTLNYPTLTALCSPLRSVVKLADAEIQTHHVKNAGEACTWDESVRQNDDLVPV